MLGCDEENFDIILNPENVKRNEPHDAVSIIAKSEKSIKIAIVIRHDKDLVCGGTLFGDELTVTFGKTVLAINIKTGELLHYEKEAFEEEFDFSVLEELI